MRGALPFLGFLTACGPAAPCPQLLVDLDRDGFGVGAPRYACGGEAWATVGGDCDDRDPAVHPGADEVCDDARVDEDCDGSANDPVHEGIDTWEDRDGDGYGDPTSAPTSACWPPVGRAANDEDCNDVDAATYPGAAIHDDPEGCLTDADGDGWGAPHPAHGALPGSDCDDREPTAFPGAVLILQDGIDQDCDGHDEVELLDTFDTGSLDPAFTMDAGVAGFSDTAGGGHAHSGRYSLILSSRRAIRTIPVNLRACDVLWWQLFVKRGPLPPDAGALLRIEAWSGIEWSPVVGGRIEGTGSNDVGFHEFVGAVRTEKAYHPAFQLRVRAPALDVGEAFLVDDLRVVCLSEGDKP